jgi:uncharacterized protein involved in oxidation of intracellular sulfur
VTVLIVVNDAGDRAHNALRLANALAEDGDLTGRRAWCAVGGRQEALEWMLSRFAAGGRAVAVCRTCMDQRGITEDRLIAGAFRSSSLELAAWTLGSDRVLTF